MRFLPALLTALALAAAPTVAAQADEDDGCTHADPCPWVVDVDPNGFQDYVEPEVTFTLGDWYEILVFSDDPDHAHTITLSGHDVSISVPADGMASDTGAFQLNQLGTFTLKDTPSNDTITVHVVEEDAVAAEQDASSSGEAKGGPALPVALVVVALAGLALLRRR